MDQGSLEFIVSASVSQVVGLKAYAARHLPGSCNYFVGPHACCQALRWVQRMSKQNTSKVSASVSPQSNGEPNNKQKAMHVCNGDEDKYLVEEGT